MTQPDPATPEETVKRWLICPKCSHGEFSAGSNPFVCRGFERLGNTHARAFMVDVVPRALLSKALEAMESTADSIRLGLPSMSTLEAVDGLDETARSIRADLGEEGEQ